MKKMIILSAILVSLTGILFSQNQAGSTPSAGSPKQFVLPGIKTFKLDNGLSVTLVNFGNIPKVTVSLIIRSGNLNESENETWLSDFTGNLMKEGTVTKSAKEIADAAASMGGNLNVSTGMETTSISGDVLSEFAPDMVGLIADVAMNPLFPASEVDRLKNDMSRDLSIQLSQPENIAFDLFSKVLYPGHPYGRIFPDNSIISAFDANRAKKFYNDNFGAIRAHLYISGVFDEPVVEEKIREVFSSWVSGPEPLINIPGVEKKASVYFADRPGAPQSVINLGIPVVDPSNKDYLPLFLTNNLLGGSFTSRITMNIRENKGYTYSPYSRIMSRYRSSVWMQFAEVGTEVTAPALKEIFYEIERLTKDTISADELQGIKNYTTGTFVLSVSTRGGIISQLAFVDLHGLDLDYLKNYIAKIQAVTASQVQEMMKTYFKPEDMTIVIAGDKGKTEKGVTALGSASK